MRTSSRARDSVGEDDVAGEEHRVGEAEGDPGRLAREPHVDKRVDAGGREPDRRQVAPGPDADRGQGDDGHEFDRRDGPERQAVDREVEAGVHDGEHGAQRPHRAPTAPEGVPGAAPEREDGGSARDAQPRDAERLHPREQQHGERGPEIVKDRADDEIQLRGRGRDDAGPPVRYSGSLHAHRLANDL